MTEIYLAAERRAILDRVLANAAFDGWTAAALRTAVTQAGYDDVMAARAFPGGVRDLLDFYLDEADREMAAACEEIDLGALRIRERIAKIVETRLRQAAPHREAVRRALAVLVLPGRGPLAVRHLARTVDVMWRRLAGDNATDFNWYTKRALLAGVYLPTLLYWLDDRSDDYTETWAFLDRRISGIMKIQIYRGKIEKRLGKLPTPWRLLARLRYPETRGA